MLLKIVQAGEKVLSEKAKPVPIAELKSKPIQDLIDLMIDTLRDKPGVGLAAPQVGESLQIIVIEDKKEYQDKVAEDVLAAQNRIPIPLTVIVNPTLTVTSTDSEDFFEGCLSVEGYRAVVKRSNAVTITGMDRHGKPMSISADGWYARILQHELDHLRGKLYVQAMHTHTFMSERCYQRDWAEALPDKIKELVRA